jgi:predicted ATPase
MRGIDVPGVYDLGDVRKVVEQVAQGRDPVADASGPTSNRRTHYLVNAARVLGLVTQTSGGWQATALGGELTATNPGSDGERAVFRRGMTDSPILQELAPGLTSSRPPYRADLTRRIRELTGLGAVTADNRARGLLGWARQVEAIPVQASMFNGGIDSTMPTLAEITFQGFKSFGDATLPLGPLTVLVGPNAAGKSNAIEGIRTLQRLARGIRLDDLNRDVQEQAASIRGTPAELCPRGQQYFGLGCTLEGPEPRRLQMRVENRGGELHIEQERLLAGEVPIYEVRAHGPHHLHTMEVAYTRRTPGQERTIPVIDLQPVFMQFLSPAPFAADPDAPPIWEMVGRFREALSQISLLDPEPRRMRGYANKSDHALKADGSNVSSVLFHIWNKIGSRQRLLDFVRSLPEQNIKTLSFPETPRGEVMVQLVEGFGGHDHAVDATLLSDGTLRVLAIAASLLSATVGSLVVVEEVDNGVHPDRSRALVDNIRSVAVERNLKVLLTTHNPALLDALSPEALADVVYCFRDPATGQSRLVRLQDADRYPELMAQGPLGQLVTRGIVERTLRSPTPPEDRVEQGLAWLRTLRTAR